METNCPGGPVERLVGRLRVAATKLGRSDEWEDLRDDLHHAAAEIERLRAAETEMLGALDALVSACELPGDHCEVEQALPAAITVIAKALGVPPNAQAQPPAWSGEATECRSAAAPGWAQNGGE